MRKYKVLLAGTNNFLISEFFVHMDFSFECLSSSMRPDDVLGHVKYFQPDMLVCCLQNETRDDISGLRGVIQKLSSNRIPLAIVGEGEDTELFEKTLPMAVDLSIKKPISAKGLEEKLLLYLKAHKKKEKPAAQKAEDKAKQEVSGSGLTELSDAQLLLKEMDALLEGGEKQTAEQKKKHILVVDDDSGVLKLVNTYLGHQYNIATAINGKVAMKFLEKKKADLVLLDYEMPGESGVQVLEKIRNDARFKDLPVVFLTGVSSKERIREVLALGPQGYLLKPINTERLSSTLKEILGE